MSSKSSEKKHQKIPIQDLEQPLKLTNAVIPFSKLTIPEKFIYYGYERIPFHERHPVYQTLIKREFAEGIKDFIKIIKKK
ncbi:MAG: hypothetical protein ACFFA4_02325 [Promethearchaeota archaeon]